MQDLIGADDWAEAYSRRRFGRFRVSRELLEMAPGEVQQILAQVLVLNAVQEHGWPASWVEYLACSLQFEPVPSGAATPMYKAVISHDVGKRAKKVVWHRVAG